MIVFLLTLLIVILVALAMSIGVILNGRRLQGSCGGVGSGDCACEASGKPVCEAKRVLTAQR